MKYQERELVTNKKYSYCIFSGTNINTRIPYDCPKLGISSQVFDNTIDDDIVNIRKRGE
jgi:hypothetical protein